VSTGENINANGAILSQEMVRMGFHRFPQSEIAMVAPDVWPQVAPILFATGYPFRAEQSALVPSGEVWFVDVGRMQLGRIVNVAVAPPAVHAHVTQDDSLDSVDVESNDPKVQKQKKRRVKDKLL
jgi:hypothetical protein